MYVLRRLNNAKALIFVFTTFFQIKKNEKRRILIMLMLKKVNCQRSMYTLEDNQ